MSNDTNVEVAQKPLEDMPIAELRKLAATFYRIVVTKDMDKQDIVNLIREREKKTTFARQTTSNGPAPGWARITLHKDHVPGASNRPVYWHINGRNYCVPRGLPVDVPIKLVDGPMKDAVESRLVEDPSEAVNSTRRWKWEAIHSYPFSEHARTDGPDPHPGDEVARGKRRQPELDYARKFGYWPSTEQIKDAIKSGLISRSTVD